MVVSEVFGEPVPAAALAGQATVLEALQAGIAGQLAVLDDAGLTGTGQSSADVLGVSGAAWPREADRSPAAGDRDPRVPRRAAGAAGQPAEPRRDPPAGPAD